MRLLLLAIVAAGLLVASPGVALGANTFTVTTTADSTPATGTCAVASCTLRQAIEGASNGDTVVVPAAANHYTVSNGQLLVNKALTITGGGAASTIVDAGSNSRVLLVTAPTTIGGLTITGGSVTGSGNGRGGAGIASTRPLTLVSVTVTGNTVSADGGFNNGGGGIFALDGLTLRSSTVSKNIVTTTNGMGDNGGGGVMQTAHNLVAIDSTISGNSATVTSGAFPGSNGGGGIYEDGNDIKLVRSTVRGNTATVTGPGDANGGGGIYTFGNGTEIRDSTISGNVAHAPVESHSGGGGVFDDGERSAYVNSTISGNSTDTPDSGDQSSGGGGIFLATVREGTVLANVTIVGNTASAARGGGLLSFTKPVTLPVPAPVTIKNSMIAINKAGAAGTNCWGPVTSAGYNFASDAGNSCGFTATGDLIAPNPHVGFLQSNGGPTQTRALLAGSPARNAGNPAGCTDESGSPLGFDQRGVPRPQPAGGRCDIGAFETVTPKCTLKPGPARVVKGKRRISATAHCTQRVAVTLATTVTIQVADVIAKAFPATVMGTAAANKDRVLSVKLPRDAVQLLKTGARESADFTLTASNANGQTVTHARIGRLKPPA